jgi:hypothetical protein
MIVVRKLRNKFWLLKCFYSLCNQLKSYVLLCKSKIIIILYKTLFRPVLTYTLETWILSIFYEKAPAVFERKVLRLIYGPVKENSEWSIGCNYKLYALYEDMNIKTFIEVGRLKSAGHVARMDPQWLVTDILNAKPEGRKKRGRP